MNPEKVDITQHAWDRFKERWCSEPPLCWRRELFKLLRACVAEKLGHGAVLRLMSHGYQPAAYYVADGWRFVFDEDSERLLTCELAYKKGVLKKPKPINRKRHGR